MHALHTCVDAQSRGGDAQWKLIRIFCHPIEIKLHLSCFDQQKFEIQVAL